MESWRRSGSFRQRARDSDRATRRLKEYRQLKVSAQTHEAIRDFEERLRAAQDAAAANVDDLPIDADAGLLGGTRRSCVSMNMSARDSLSESSCTSGRALMLKAASDSHLLHDADTNPCAKRPPSPLGLYDYGSISLRPRSTFAQRRQQQGEATRPKHRQASSCGFYFPGAEYRQGSYGFSMLEPIHMTSKSWQKPHAPPTRYGGDSADLRPLTIGEVDPNRNHASGPVISDIVRPNKAHDRRAMLSFQTLDRKREEQLVERARFENGVFEGRWDPKMDHSSAVLEEAPMEHHGWLREVGQDAKAEQPLASRILFGLEGALREGRGKLSALFRAHNSGTPGVLEPEEFMAGLVRHGILEDGEVTHEEIMSAMLVIDPAFDGHVNFSVVGRAVQAAQGVQRERSRATEELKQQHHARISTSYGESLPIDVVKVDWQARSLCDFERAFERFRKQQRELLSQHHEIAH